MDEKFIVIMGNPVDGLNFLGPFDDRDAAIRYGEQTGDGDWWITTLSTPFGK